MIGGPYQSKLTPYTGLPESTPTFTLSLMEELPQLIKNGLIFTDLLWVCSQFALNFFHFYFNHKFHTQGDIFWKNCCESTYQNLSSFQNLYQLLSYLKIWACWTWFALNFLEMLSEHEIGTFPHFFDGQNLAVFTFCPFLTRSSCLGLFYHFESTKGHWPGYPKLFLLLV